MDNENMTNSLESKLYDELVNMLNHKFTGQELRFMENFIDIKSVFFGAYYDAVGKNKFPTIDES